MEPNACEETKPQDIVTHRLIPRHWGWEKELQ